MQKQRHAAAGLPVASTVVRAMIPAVVAWTFFLTTGGPVTAQNAPATSRSVQDGSTPEAAAALAPLLGPWIRNDSLSEDPVVKNESMWRNPELAPPIMRDLASSAAEALGAVTIDLDGEHVLFTNPRDEQTRFNLDGRLHTDANGNETQVLRADGSLKTEAFVSGWLLVETFYRRDDQLLRMTDLQNARFPSLRVRTVYEYAGAAPPPGPPVAEGAHRYAREAVIRVVPPEGRHGELLGGKVEIQTLIIDPDVSSVDFFLDGHPLRRVRKRPFNTHVELARPPREQTLEVRAYGLRGEFAGNDLIVLNRHDAPFAVRIADLAAAAANGAEAVRVETRVSVPRSSALERVDFYRSGDLVATVNDFGTAAEPGTARTIPATALIAGVEASDFVRVSATLTDGRVLEDAALVEGSEYQSEIDIRLVQLQILATDRDGNPMSGLSADDFEIREDGERRRAEELHTARDVPLVLGLAIDSSTSMEPIWQQLKYIASRFLDRTLAPGDRAFLVDFDAMVRLLQPLTGDKTLLSTRLDRLIPFGGTAVNDGLLFSLLQYRSEPGRRALVVITDGIDEHSRSRREQATDFAERLGLPIYFIQLDPSGLRYENLRLAAVGIARPRLRRISRQTGGRLFTIELSPDASAWAPKVQTAFDQIGEDLSHQHVLTWYSNAPSGSAIVPNVRVTRRGLKLRSAVPLDGIE